MTLILEIKEEIQSAAAAFPFSVGTQKGSAARHGLGRGGGQGVCVPSLPKARRQVQLEGCWLLKCTSTESQTLPSS